MHKIDTASATAQGTFTEGDPQTATPPTTVSDDWLNAVQGELVAVIEAAGIVLDKSDNTQLSQALGVLGGTTGTLKNYIINGDLRLWQRGTSFLNIGNAGAYTADRWLIAGDYTGGAGEIDVTRELINAAGVAEIGTFGTVEEQNAFYYARLAGNTGEEATVAGPIIEQRVDHLLELAEQDVCFSIYLQTGPTATKTGGLLISQDFGSGGSTPVTAVTEAISFQGSWKRFECTATMPSVFGKTIGPGAHIKCWYLGTAGEVGASDYIDFTLAQLERGSAASRFAYRPPELELLLASRFWEKSYPHDVVPGTASAFAGEAHAYTLAGTGPLGLGQRFRAKKRAVPTVTWYDPLTGAANKINWSGSAVSVTSPGSAISEDATGVPTVTPAQAAGGVLAHWVADAEL